MFPCELIVTEQSAWPNMAHKMEINLFEIIPLNISISNTCRGFINMYYMALLNAVERSVHLHEAFPTSGGEFFFNNDVDDYNDNDVAMHIMTSVKESHVFHINPPCNLSTPASSVATSTSLAYYFSADQHYECR